MAAALRVTGARGTGAAQTREIDARQKRWDRDDAAFIELVKQGIEPPTLDGSADLAARATCDAHVITGKPHIKEESFRWYEDSFEQEVTTPNVTPIEEE